jgi:hypothetical protein
MRILWASNYTAQSAYAIQARLFVPRLMAAGHDVTVFNLANGGALPQVVDGVQVLPVGADPLGSDMMRYYAERAKTDAVITLIDAWGMNPSVMKEVRWFPLAPVDHNPTPPAVVSALKACQLPIAITRYGESKLQASGFTPLYWPLAVDPAVWHPQDKAAARRKLGIPDDVSRKGIPELLAAWSMVEPKHERWMLYMHTSRVGNLGSSVTSGVNIDTIIRTFGIRPNSVMFPDEGRYRSGIPPSELALFAAAADVLVLPSRGEGFGCPLIEFQRTGCPVITTNCAGGAELCFGGWLLEGEVEWSWQQSSVVKPGIAAIAEALEAAYAERGNPERRQRAIEGAREYDIDDVMGKHVLKTLHMVGACVLEAMAV